MLERVLSAAAWAPSGSNIQPWHAYLVTGAPLAELKKRAGERLAALGIAREDIEARQRAAAENWDCFGAPAALFCYGMSIGYEDTTTSHPRTGRAPFTETVRFVED